jgi:predicted phage terminase large subunit-like protein
VPLTRQWEILAKHDFSFFIDYDSEGRDKDGRHLDVLDETLMEVSKGELKRVIITMPPRHGKSERVSKKFPAWHVGRNPMDEIILASYSIDLSRDFSRIARDTLIEQESIFGVKADKQKQAAESWGIQGHRGGVTAAGVGGAITGKGARIAIIDDPVKNAEEAHSEVMREKIWEWYQSTLYTRLTPDGRIIVVMTRWHEDDLVGRLLKKEREDITNGTHKGDRWVVINFPAIAEDDDILGRIEGDPLWPEFGFDEKRLSEIQSDVGPYVWNALYQQRPNAAEGTIFKRDYFKYFEEQKIGTETYLHVGEKKFDLRDCWAFQTVDTANSVKTINDYFVISTWYITPDKDLLLYDVFRTHIEGPDQKPLMKEQSKRYAHLRFQAIENITFGTNLIQECLREGMTILSVKVDKDKVTRSLPIGAKYASGKVYHRSGAPWLGDYEDELLSFPNGKHDDQADTASMAGELIHSGMADGVPTYPDTSIEARVRQNIKNLSKKQKGMKAL